MRPLDLTLPADLMLGILPELVLSACSLLVLLVAAWRHRTDADSRLAGRISLAGLVVAFAVTLSMWLGGARAEGLPHMVAVVD